MKKIVLFVMCLFFLRPASAQVAVKILNPEAPYGYNVLPGSVRRLFPIVTGGTLNTVTWSTSGGTLSNANGNWVDVTAPSTGGTCVFAKNGGIGGIVPVPYDGGSGYTDSSTVTFSGGTGSGAAATPLTNNGGIYGFNITNPGSYTSAPTVSVSGGSGFVGDVSLYSVNASNTFTVTATSVDDNTKSATISINVCTLTPVAAIVPFYRTLYAHQNADLQSFITGSTNLTGSWAITSSPAGGDGSLSELASTATASWTTGSTVITLAAQDTSLVTGMPVFGTGIPTGTTVLSYATSSPWTVTLSQATTSGTGGTINFSSFRDVVFSASVAGRYTITWTSNATGSPTATTTMFVTGNAMPYQVTLNNTEPVDSTVDPAMTGTVYDVAPNGTSCPGVPSSGTTVVPTIASVPMKSLATTGAGTTIRIHNCDTTGSAPTTYYEYIQIWTAATATQPFRVVGVPDSYGNLPILEENGATGRQENSWNTEGLSGVMIYNHISNNYNLYPYYNSTLGQQGSAALYTVIEGLNVRDASSSNSYWIPGNNLTSAVSAGATSITVNSTNGFTSSGNLLISGQTISYTGIDTTKTIFTGVSGVTANLASASLVTQLQSWGQAVSCMRSFSEWGLVAVGNELYHCDNGTFTDFNGNNAWNGFCGYSLWEGNWVHYGGLSGSASAHQFYHQCWYEVFQFNRVDGYNPLASGSNFKDRGPGLVFRYNFLGDGAARTMDLVDNQDASLYQDVGMYLNSGLIGQGDTYSPSNLASIQELSHQNFVYGNTYLNTSSANPLHFNEDHDAGLAARLGDLWFYNNSFYEGPKISGGNYEVNLFDTGTGGGGASQVYEWNSIRAYNNAIEWSNPTAPYFSWDSQPQEFTYFGINAVNSGWGSLPPPSTNPGVAGDGWSTSLPSPYSYQNASSALSTFNTSNILGLSNPVFSNPAAFVPSPALYNAGTVLSGPPAYLPVRFQFNPANWKITARTQPTTLGAIDYTVPYLTALTITPSGQSIQLGVPGAYTATCTYSDSSTTNCTSSATWSTGSSAVATVTSGTVSGVNRGATTVSAALSGIHSNAATVTVFVTPATYVNGIQFNGTHILN